MEVFNAILGLGMMYATGHLFALQKKGYSHLSQYEKFITWAGMVSITFLYLGVMFGE